jgi:thioredoxin 2
MGSIVSVNVVCPNCLKVNRIPKKEYYAKVNCGACKYSMLNTKPLEADMAKFNLVLVNSEVPVVVDFWAPWCGPCLQMAPAFEEVSKTIGLQAQFVKVNTEENQALASGYGIQSIPTLIVFKHGQEVERLSGALSSVQLQSWVRQYL